ncbi:hypothetical protein [Microscilla marina]|uniref:Uncharacterized protein n=1 Tax=Microscilla marina ATCC 23134 TaxID=313606 RepID=A1ZJZ9_MICM2|nr:hypothetical protein [Microscilla marina]EAY29452.1 hypothetical protein M23134_01512 [Microscilla marina ATCC 23134]
MTKQTLSTIPSRVRIITIDHKEKIEVTFRKATPKEQKHFEQMPLSEKKQFSVHLYNIKMMMVTKSLKGRYEFLKSAFKAFNLTVETYEEFKKRKLREADEQI